MTPASDRNEPCPTCGSKDAPRVCCPGTHAPDDHDSTCEPCWDPWHAATPAPRDIWQHDETGRIVTLPAGSPSPGKRYFRVRGMGGEVSVVGTGDEALDLDALEALLKRASPGEWSWTEDRDGYPLELDAEGVGILRPGITVDPTDGRLTAHITNDSGSAEASHPDFALIVALRNAAPSLLAAARERDELQAERDALRKRAEEAERKWNAAVYDADKVRGERDKAEREWHAATARAEKAEAALRDARAAKGGA